MFPETVQQVKRWLKIVAGFTLLAVGIVMLVTPGPGWLVIAMGLALLAAEYLWARRLLDRLKSEGARLRNAVRPSSFAKRRATAAAKRSLAAAPEVPLVASASASLEAPLDPALGVALSHAASANVALDAPLDTHMENPLDAPLDTSVRSID